MYEKDYTTALYEKVQAEYDDFIAEMKCKSADEIIESAYQIVIKDEITVFCRDCSPKLTDGQFEALLSQLDEQVSQVDELASKNELKPVDKSDFCIYHVFEITVIYCDNYY